MRYILDASVAVKWVIPELDSDKAATLRDETLAGTHQLLAPDLLQIEAAHCLTRLERRRIIQSGESITFLGQLLLMPVDYHPFLPLLPRAIVISSDWQIGVYDCVYVALAERERCEPVTADARLVANLQHAFPFIVALASLP